MALNCESNATSDVRGADENIAASLKFKVLKKS